MLLLCPHPVSGQQSQDSLGDGSSHRFCCCDAGVSEDRGGPGSYSLGGWKQNSLALLSTVGEGFTESPPTQALEGAWPARLALIAPSILLCPHSGQPAAAAFLALLHAGCVHGFHHSSACLGALEGSGHQAILTTS